MRILLAAIGAGIVFPVAAGFQPLTGGGGANEFGDDRLSYRDGVVYDDDLVPGRGPDQPFLVDEQGGAGASATTATPPAARDAGGPEPAGTRRRR